MSSDVQSSLDSGWFPDPDDPFIQRWWDGTAWTTHVAPLAPAADYAEIDRPLMRETSGSARRSKGAELEQQIARFIESLGYDVRTNVVLEGRSGSRHEIDVLGEKHDALSTFRVAVECKAWDQPIEKDVIAKFSYVLQDLGLREGIVVALGGSRSGATTAATELGITLWGPEEISERLGAVGLADLRTQAPRHEATGFPVVTDLQGAEAFFQREARGTLGFGAETIAWTSLVWLPVSVVQVALSRTEGRIKKVTQTRRIWNSYDRIGGSHLGRWSTQPPLTSVDIANSSLRPKERDPAAARAISDAFKKYQSVSTQAARERHAKHLAVLGIPTGYAVVAEQTTSAFAPLYVAIAQRKGAERAIVVDAHRNELQPQLGRSLSHNIHWLRESLA